MGGTRSVKDPPWERQADPRSRGWGCVSRTSGLLLRSPVSASPRSPTWHQLQEQRTLNRRQKARPHGRLQSGMGSATRPRHMDSYRKSPAENPLSMRGKSKIPPILEPRCVMCSTSAGLFANSLHWGPESKQVLLTQQQVGWEISDRAPRPLTDDERCPRPQPCPLYPPSIPAPC